MIRFFSDMAVNPLLLSGILAGLLAAVACGLIGPYVITRRIVFLSGAIAHIVVGGLGAVIFLRFRFEAEGETVTATFDSDDDFAFGLQLAADIPFGEGSWALNLALQYIDTGLSVISEDGDFTELKFDPLILAVGFGYQF